MNLDNIPTLRQGKDILLQDTTTLDLDSIPSIEESLLQRTGRAVKGVLDIPENITKNVVLPFSENIATQVVGGAGAVISPAVAGRNYLTTLMATGDLEKAYESAKSVCVS